MCSLVRPILGQRPSMVAVSRAPLPAFVILLGVKDTDTRDIVLEIVLKCAVCIFKDETTS